MSKMKKIIMVALIVLVSCALVSMTATVKATDQNPIIDISGNLDISTGNETSSNTTSNNNVAPSINTTENSQVIQPVNKYNREYNKQTSTNRCNRRHNSNVLHRSLCSISYICLQKN